MGDTMKIDFHTHILPKLDDGASSLDMSLEMLSVLQQQGVDVVVLTPHYYSHRRPVDEFLSARQDSYDLLRKAHKSSVQLRLGAEVYFSDYLFNQNDLTPLCIQGTRTILIELPYNKTIDRTYVEKLDRLITEYAVIPVLAHVERYPSLMHSLSTLERFLDLGCVLQANLSSFTEFGKRKLLKLVKDGYIGALGTDTHNTTSRAPDYDNGYTRIGKVLSQTAQAFLQDSMVDLLHIDR